MMQVKIECRCGQKYAFDVEPVGARMPTAVICPACGADGTEAANAIIGHAILSGTYVAPPPPIAAAQEQGKSQPPAAAKSSPAPLPRQPSAAPKRKKKWLTIAAVSLLVIGLGGVLYWRSTRSTLDRAPNRAELEGAIKRAQQAVASFNGASVVMGRIVLKGPGDPRDVRAQMEILAGGYFAGDTRDLERPIGFRMNGYSPLDVDLMGKEGDLIDLGTLHMTPLPPSQLSAITGHLALEGSGDPTKAQVLLRVANGPMNSARGGTAPRRRAITPIPLSVDSAGQISGTGFSPISFNCTITAPGFVSQMVRVSIDEGQPFDLGTITLEKPKPIEVSYIVTPQPPFELTEKQTATLHGGDRWKADKKTVGWDLEFLQRQGGLAFNAGYFPCDLTDLGAGALDDFVKATPGPGRNPRGMKVESGHVYWLNAPVWKHSVLFRVDFR